jgi:hypothetical protein
MIPNQPDIAITTRSLAALQAIHRFGAELLSHGCHAGVIFEALAHDPDCALAQAYAAALFLTQMTREGRVQAAPRLAAANQLSEHATLRERQIIAAISHWAVGDEQATTRLLHDVVREYPHDLLSAKLCQILQLSHGDLAGMCRTASIASAAEPESGYAAGLFAFALEQAGETDRAEALAYRALERNPLTDPWAQHTLAHVHAAREDWVKGRAFLRAHVSSWNRCSSFMLTHNWWHAALFALELDDGDHALRQFDEHVWGVRKHHCQDQINAISLLARLEMHGIDAGSRWYDIADHVAPQVNDRISGFLDLHYLYALARSGRDAVADELLQDLVDRSGGAPTGLLARGIVGHARGRWYDAALAIGQARGRIGMIGGSQMQRALFEDMLFDSLSRNAQTSRPRERLYA